MDKTQQYIKRIADYLADENNREKLYLISQFTREQLFNSFKNKEINWFELRLNGFIKNNVEEKYK